MFKILGKYCGKAVFKTILLPGYRFFLFTKKYSNKYLLHNPDLPIEYNRNILKNGTLLHIVILVLFIFVILNNIATHDTYAEEFGKNSIMAQMFTDEFDIEIVEYSFPMEEISDKPKTESIIDSLSTLESKIIIGSTELNNRNEMDKVALSQGGEALIKPTITPFESNDSAGSTGSSLTKSKIVQSYTVESGDTLSTIAERFGVSINTILWENNLSLSSYIRPGDKLSILPVTGISYTVRSGDTMSGIAKKFGTDLDKIVAFNNIEDGKIRPMQKIIIPDGKLGYTAPVPRSVGSIADIFTPSAGTPSVKNFLWPSDYKRITQYYHWRHHAIDIGAQAGTPIYASQAGRVERAGWSTGYGYNIVINHGGGVKTLYAHASKLYVKRGDQVAQGEVIGAVGSTGWSTGPHIHFEIVINGAKVNPLSYL